MRPRHGFGVNSTQRLSSVSGYSGSAGMSENVRLGDNVQGVPAAGGSVRAGFRSLALEHIDPTGIGIARRKTRNRRSPGHVLRPGPRDLAGRTEQCAKPQGPDETSAATQYLREGDLGQKSHVACFMNRARQAFVNAEQNCRGAEVAPGALFSAAGFSKILRCRFGGARRPACGTFAQERGFGRSGHDKRALKVQLLP